MCDAGTDTVQHANTDVEVLLVGNKTDMADKRTVSSAQALQARFPSPPSPLPYPLSSALFLVRPRPAFVSIESCSAATACVRTRARRPRNLLA